MTQALWQLFSVFLQIGAFSIGGGYAVIPMIRDQVVIHQGWITQKVFTDIITISQMTPGPIGINSATYCGYAAAHNAGFEGMMAVLGSATATFALVLPSFILMVLISRMFMKYMRTPAVQSVFMGLRPAVVGLLAAATLLLCDVENFSSPDINPWQFGVSLFLFFATFIGTMWMKINPIRMICFAAFAGLVLLY